MILTELLALMIVGNDMVSRELLLVLRMSLIFVFYNRVRLENLFSGALKVVNDMD